MVTIRNHKTRRSSLTVFSRAYWPYRHLHAGFLIEFVDQWKEQAPSELQRLLNDPWAFKNFATTISFRSKLLESGGVSSDRQLEAVLHLVFPDTFEGIALVKDKRLVAEAEVFAALVADQPEDVDQRVQQIRLGLEAGLGRDFDFYDTDIRIQWDPTLRNWVGFVKLAKEYVASGRLETEEIGYKREMGEDLAAARRAVLAWRIQLARPIEACSQSQTWPPDCLDTPQ